MLAVLALAELLGMTLWFSATVAAPAIMAELRLTPGEAAWLTMAVQAGFVCGTLVTALLNCPTCCTVFLSQNWKFTAPVYIGDTITAAVEVAGLHASKPVTQLRVRVTRQDGEAVPEGEAWCYTLGPDSRDGSAPASLP